MLHQSVMSGEVLEYLKPVKGGRYLDGTLGLGGHTLKILEACQGECRVMGIDLDQDALDLSRQRLAEFGDRVLFFHDAYQNFDSHLLDLGWPGLDGAVLDLGVSSLQLDSPEKGFSFISDGPLDMRMGRAAGLAPASVLLERVSLYDLKKIIAQFGEEPLAGRIARAIIQARDKKKIQTTLELASIVEAAYPAKRRAMARNHPATRTFQALRIAVNRELDNLEEFLRKILIYLNPGARLVIISFHSLEDRVVKHFFKKEAQGCLCPPMYPVCRCNHEKRLTILTKKPLVAREQEVRENPRSRSAKLRAAERFSDPDS
ncbi:16S rRNA (cytosine(1402)-N(4))-methyltransferase RsmH [Desulfonatronovibrio hydrogenovorans]|uniref:16S rRNA (cytosine(1402)-N(4))-methyltransferase RsmH n=1 Tax=Desulfonatronovibrio hydrogenovorans TaxID=53245 RepID=UPI00048E3DA1|nr:16S rRNA (cytosine(1402)-N(4))-methyltransferase RsmH [Desulfonatronovibrio hydrogenovorans]